MSRIRDNLSLVRPRSRLARHQVHFFRPDIPNLVHCCANSVILLALHSAHCHLSFYSPDIGLAPSTSISYQSRQSQLHLPSLSPVRPLSSACFDLSVAYSRRSILPASPALAVVLAPPVATILTSYAATCREILASPAIVIPEPPVSFVVSASYALTIVSASPTEFPFCLSLPQYSPRGTAPRRPRLLLLLSIHHLCFLRPHFLSCCHPCFLLYVYVYKPTHADYDLSLVFRPAAIAHHRQMKAEQSRPMLLPASITCQQCMPCCAVVHTLPRQTDTPKTKAKLSCPMQLLPPSSRKQHTLCCCDPLRTCSPDTPSLPPFPLMSPPSHQVPLDPGHRVGRTELN